MFKLDVEQLFAGKPTTGATFKHHKSDLTAAGEVAGIISLIEEAKKRLKRDSDLGAALETRKYILAQAAALKGLVGKATPEGVTIGETKFETFSEDAHKAALKGLFGDNTPEETTLKLAVDSVVEDVVDAVVAAGEASQDRLSDEAFGALNDKVNSTAQTVAALLAARKADKTDSVSDDFVDSVVQGVEEQFGKARDVLAVVKGTREYENTVREMQTEVGKLIEAGNKFAADDNDISSDAMKARVMAGKYGEAVLLIAKTAAKLGGDDFKAVREHDAKHGAENSLIKTDFAPIAQIIATARNKTLLTAAEAEIKKASEPFYDDKAAYEAKGLLAHVHNKDFRFWLNADMATEAEYNGIKASLSKVLKAVAERLARESDELVDVKGPFSVAVIKPEAQEGGEAPAAVIVAKPRGEEPGGNTLS